MVWVPGLWFAIHVAGQVRTPGCLLDGRRPRLSLDILSFYQKQHVLLSLTMQSLDAIKCAAILNQIGPLFESGALKPPVIAERFALADAHAAYLRAASGGQGCARNA